MIREWIYLYWKLDWEWEMAAVSSGEDGDGEDGDSDGGAGKSDGCHGLVQCLTSWESGQVR